MKIGKYIAAAAALLSAAAAHADAIEIDAGDIGSSYTVNYDGYADGQTIDGLTGQSTFTLTDWSDTSVTFDYSITNTSSDPIDASRISIFGFNTDPDITKASATGTFDKAAYDSTVPSGFGTIEVCFRGAGDKNCSGGGGEGVTIGETGTGTLTLTFSSAIDSLTLSDFFIRYQSICGCAGTPGSAIGRGTVSSTGSTGGTPVPAPAAPLLFVLGLAFLGWRYGRGEGASLSETPAFA